MVQLKTLFLAVLSLSVATCNPVEKRDATLVLSDLAAVGTSLNTLTASVNSYTGGLTGALTIASNGIALDTATNQATTDATAAAAFTVAESSSVTTAISSITPQIQATLTALVTKESLFAASGLAPLVLSQLNTLLADSDKLGAALAAKAQAGDVAALKASQATVDASFAFAIAVFSS